MPMPQAAAAGTTSASGERLSREYSTWLVASTARPGTARCQVAPRAVCQPDQLLTPTYDARPLLTAMSSALSVSSTGVASDQTCTCHRSRWSTPRRFSEVSRHWSR